MLLLVDWVRELRGGDEEDIERAEVSMDTLQALRNLTSATEFYLGLVGSQPCVVAGRAYPELRQALKDAMKVIQEEQRRPKMLVDTKAKYETETQKDMEVRR